MNTDKTGAPYYQRPSRRLSPACRVRRKGLAEQRRLRACSSMAKTPCRRSRVNPRLRFIAHFNDVLIYVLLAAALLKAVMGHWIDMAVILAVAVVNALIGFIQESNAEKSLQSIRNMLSSEAVVIRRGNHETIPTTLAGTRRYRGDPRRRPYPR